MKLSSTNIAEFHREMHRKFRATESGLLVDYLGKQFVVHKNVFWPGDDSRPLVENFVVHPGEEVLDLCTGAGHIAVFAADKGAARVVALDRNPSAVENARANAERHGFSRVIEVRQSDMFSALGKDEKFDVVTMNPPFLDHELDDIVSNSTWDEDLHVHKEFFAHVGDYLKPDGRAYIAQADFGPMNEVKRMAKEAGFAIRELGKYNRPFAPIIFYAFELQPKRSKAAQARRAPAAALNAAR
jgi:release factor glutamine methyltransferase